MTRQAECGEFFGTLKAPSFGAAFAAFAAAVAVGGAYVGVALNSYTFKPRTPAEGLEAIRKANALATAMHDASCRPDVWTPDPLLVSEPDAYGVVTYTTCRGTVLRLWFEDGAWWFALDGRESEHRLRDSYRWTVAKRWLARGDHEVELAMDWPSREPADRW